MKKLLVIVVCFMATIVPVNASTKTFERTEDNLRVDNSINVNNSNIDDILSTPSVNASEKVYDFADLFTSSEESIIYDKAIEYISSHNMDLVIVTIDDNPKANAREYGMDFYDYNDFGTDNKHSGILLIIDMDNRRYEMITSGEAIIMYDDARIDNILDYIYNDIKYKTYYNGVTKFISRVSSYASDGIPESNKYASVDEYGNITINQPLPWIKMLLASAVITLIVMVILVLRNKMVRKATTAKEYLDKDTLAIHTLSDVLVDKHVSRVRIERSSSNSFSSSSSSRSGGSSTSRGSSGRSHGGGGRSF